jgi:taurine dioxygenase
MTISSQTLTSSGFGISLESLDIAKLDSAGAAEVLGAFYQSGGLLVVRDQQDLTRRDLVEFIRLFGSVELNEKYNPNFLESAYPELLRIGNTMQDGERDALFIQADPPPLMWHTDDSFRHPQPIGSCLFCVKTPPAGGDTGFVGMQSAYEALAVETRDYIDDLKAVHSYDYLNELLRKNSPHRPPLSEKLKKEIPPITRPLVAQHPVSKKKGLYLPISHIESIPGLTETQKCNLLDELMGHMTQPDFTHMHQWKPGDLVIWDNRSAMHAPTPFDDQAHERLMFRLTFNGQQIVGFNA